MMNNSNVSWWSSKQEVVFPVALQDAAQLAEPAPEIPGGEGRETLIVGVRRVLNPTVAPKTFFLPTSNLLGVASPQSPSR
jgi:hypothetical protein